VAVGLHHLKAPTADPDELAKPGTATRPPSPALSRTPVAITKDPVRLRRNDSGEPIEIHVIIPPNLAETFARGKVLLVFEGATNRSRNPLNAFVRSGTYAMSAGDAALLDAAEMICGGDTPGMVQLSTKDFASLLPAMAGHPRLTLGRKQSLGVSLDPIFLPAKATLEPSGEILIALKPSGLGTAQILAHESAVWAFSGSKLQPVEIPRAFFQSGFASDLVTVWAEARREEGAYSKQSVTDEQRSLSPNRPKDDGECTLKTRPRFSPSGLERYAECPFQFFALNGLRCAERALFEVDLRSQGRFEHAVLARFHHDLVSNSLRWRDLNPAQIRKHLDYAVERELQSPGRAALIASAGSRFRSKAIANRLESLIRLLIEGMQSHAFDPSQAEVRFTCDLNNTDSAQGRPILLEGQIDRIDMAQDEASGMSFVLVSDYKRRKRTFDELKFQCGTAIQSVLYLAAAIALDPKSPARPGGWVWVPLAPDRSRSPSRARINASEAKPWMRGRLNHAAIACLHTRPDLASPFSIRLKKDGQPYASADLRPAEELDALLAFAWEMARGLALRILDGGVEAAPLADKQSLPCDYCAAKDVCRFEPQLTEPRKTPLIAIDQPCAPKKHR
jgi:hypothetical protein